MTTVPEHGAARRPTRVVAIGASAGGVDALQRVVAALPADFPAAICVVLHIAATGSSVLAPILDRAGPLVAEPATDGAPIEPGRIYVAPPDRHLLVRGERLALTTGPKENGVRPAVDPLFRTLASSWGPRAVAVVLSGALDDGSSGVVSVLRAGGTVVVQHPDDALVPSMPENALAAAGEALIAPAHELAAVLTDLVSQPVQEVRLMPPDVDGLTDALEPPRPEGPASGFTCPECSGALWELREGDVVRYRCRVGHSYSEEAFIDHQGHAVEAALWAALEVLEERGELLSQLADRMAGRSSRSAERFRRGAFEAHARAELIRRALAVRSAPSAEPDEVTEASAG